MLIYGLFITWTVIKFQKPFSDSSSTDSLLEDLNNIPLLLSKDKTINKPITPPDANNNFGPNS